MDDPSPSSPAPFSPGPARLSPWPVYRNNVSDFLHNAQRRKNISTWWEIDVTAAMARLGQIQRDTNIGVTLNPYLIHRFALAVRQHPQVQAVRVPWRRRIAHFDGVDVSTVVEQRVPNHGSMLLPYTLRDADRKSLATLCAELRHARKRNLIAEDPGIRLRGRLAYLPRFLRLLFWRWVDLDPDRRRRVRGTVGLTNLSYFAVDQRPAFGLPLVLLPVNLAIGSTYQRLVPCATDPRGFRVANMLCVTLTVDHEVIDGAPAARFVGTLTEAIERAEGLDDAFARELTALLGNPPVSGSTAAPAAASPAPAP